MNGSEKLKRCGGGIAHHNSVTLFQMIESVLRFDAHETVFM